MNKYIFLSLNISFAAFGAAHDDSKFIKVLDAARQNDTKTVLELGKQLSVPDKRSLASDTEFLRFIGKKIDAEEINETNQKSFLEIFHYLANPVGRTAIRTLKSAPIQEFIEQRESEQQEEAKILAAKQEEIDRNTQRAADLEHAVTAFDEIITRFHSCASSDARDDMVREIEEQAFKLKAIDHEKVFARPNSPFANLIDALVDEQNIHALRQLKYILEVTNLLSAENDLRNKIVSMVNGYEDIFLPVQQEDAPNIQPNLPVDQTISDHIASLHLRSDEEILAHIATMDINQLNAVLEFESNNPQKTRLDNLILQHLEANENNADVPVDQTLNAYIASLHLRSDEEILAYITTMDIDERNEVLQFESDNPQKTRLNILILQHLEANGNNNDGAIVQANQELNEQANQELNEQAPPHQPRLLQSTVAAVFLGAGLCTLYYMLK